MQASTEKSRTLKIEKGGFEAVFASSQPSKSSSH